MVIYQVSKKMFFVSNGIDYAAAVDMENDVTIFTSRKKAEAKYNELVNCYSAMYKVEPKVVTRIGMVYRSTEIKNYDTRIVLEISRKETN